MAGAHPLLSTLSRHGADGSMPCSQVTGSFRRVLLATVGVRPASRLGGFCVAQPEGGFSARQPAGLTPTPARCLAVARILVPHDELSSIDTFSLRGARRSCQPA